MPLMTRPMINISLCNCTISKTSQQHFFNCTCNCGVCRYYKEKVKREREEANLKLE